MAAQKVEVTPEDVAAWVRSKLLEPAPFPEEQSSQATAKAGSSESVVEQTASRNYWMAPASGQKGVSAQQSLKHWLGKNMWGFHESTPSRRQLREGDRIAFYANQKGVVAYATVAGDANLLVTPAEWPEPVPQTKPIYKLPLTAVTWMPSPVVIDSKTRSTLDAFKGKDPKANWAWIVQTTRRLTPADFRRLTGQ